MLAHTYFGGVIVSVLIAAVAGSMLLSGQWQVGCGLAVLARVVVAIAAELREMLMVADVLEEVGKNDSSDD